MEQPISATPERARSLLLNLSRIAAAAALVGLAAPWLFGGSTEPPPFMLVLSGMAMAVALGVSFLRDQARAAAGSLIAASLALLLLLLTIAGAMLAGTAGPLGIWVAGLFALATIQLDRIILPPEWRSALPEGVRPYTESAPAAAFFLGVSSGFPYAMIGATLTTRLAQDGITKSTVTAFTLAFLVYNLKFLWAWIVDGVRIPVLGRLGQRVSWLILAGLLVMAAVANLALQDPSANIVQTAVAAILVGVAGATFDIVIDGYRIELLEPRQLGVGSGMSQYGWRIGSVAAGALALVLAARVGWEAAYLACAAFALPAMLTGLVMGEPARHREPSQRKGVGEVWASIIGPFSEFFMRSGAVIVLLFILLHKIGDTLGQLVLRLLLDDMGYTNDEIAIWDVGVGFWAYLIGIFVGGWLYAQIGMKRSVLLSLILMGVSNASFAVLAAAGHTNLGLAAAIGFENFASGIGGVVVIAYFSALTDLRFTASQYALISAAASVVGRVLTGTTAGALVEAFGYVNFYLLTTVAALPGILLFWWMMRTGMVDRSIGSAGKVGEGDVRAEGQPAGG